MPAFCLCFYSAVEEAMTEVWYIDAAQTESSQRNDIGVAEWLEADWPYEATFTFELRQATVFIGKAPEFANAR